MHKFGSLILVLISLVFFSCENTENSVITSEQNESISLITNNFNDDVTSQNLTITKTIDGALGGTISLDTAIIDNSGNEIAISLNLSFDPESFYGVKTITVIPNPATVSVQFYPAMVFNKPAKLNLSYTGIDLKSLGFSSNSKVDFVYVSDSGNIQYILKDEVKIKFDKNQLYTKKALLPHFSRYAFVRKSL